jgi:hypothetical protein
MMIGPITTRIGPTAGGVNWIPGSVSTGGADGGGVAAFADAGMTAAPSAADAAAVAAACRMRNLIPSR